MLDDWVSFAGTEIINKARTRAYMKSFVPGLAVSTNEGCEDIGLALGETYHTPQQDEAPWYSPYNTASNEFYGLYPLSIEGAEDSTSAVTVTETTTEGGVPGRRRSASRPMRFTALLVAGTDKGKAYGLSWLREVLTGSNCDNGDCGGDDLCYFAACPDVCVVDGEPDVPVDVTVTGLPAGWQYTGTASYSSGQISVTGEDPSVSVPLYALVPGGWYRASVRARAGAADAPVTVSIPGTSSSVTFPLSTGASFGPVPESGGALTLEFQAANTVSRLLVAAPDSVDVAAVKVWRIPAPTMLSDQNLAADSQEASSWTAAGPTMTGLTTLLTHVPSLGAAATSVFSSSPGTIDADTVYVAHTIGGLTVGKRYRVSALARRFENFTPAVGTDLAVPGASVYSSVDTVEDASQGATWHEVVFTATDVRQEVRVQNSVAYTPGATNTPLWIGVLYLRVDEVTEDALPSLVVDDTLRTLRMVTTTSGPSVTQEYDSSSAFICKVEWGMSATKPRALGDSVVVGRSLPPSYSVVPERVCTNGAQVLSNLVTNPSFETGTTGWTALNATLTNPTSADPVSGTHVLRITSTGTTPGARSNAQTTTPYRVWTGSAYVRIEPSLSSDVYLTLDGYNGSSWGAIAGDLVPLRGSDGWARLHASVAVPPGITQVAVHVYSALTSTHWVEVDGVMLTEGYALRPYFDGDSTNAAWDGTAHASTSTWTAPARLTSIVDPDCPPPPDPPRPPVIDNDCLDTPATWLRYVMPIPAEATQASPVSFPELTLTTSSLSARGVRVRFYADPFNQGIAGVEECNWCGEFWLSYLPPDASLTVDAAVQRVQVTTQGQTVDAMNLLYGSDGGPMTWPELACGIGYLVVVDLDADNTPLIDARLSVTPGY